MYLICKDENCYYCQLNLGPTVCSQDSRVWREKPRNDAILCGWGDWTNSLSFSMKLLSFLLHGRSEIAATENRRNLISFWIGIGRANKIIIILQPQPHQPKVRCFQEWCEVQWGPPIWSMVLSMNSVHIVWPGIFISQLDYRVITQSNISIVRVFREGDRSQTATQTLQIAAEALRRSVTVQKYVSVQISVWWQPWKFCTLSTYISVFLQLSRWLVGWYSSCHSAQA